MQRWMSILEDSEGGANMVMRDMRYIWSEIDSPLTMLVELLRREEGNKLLDTKSTPSFTLCSLQTLQHVEEWDRRSRIGFGGTAWDIRNDGFDRPWCLCTTCCEDTGSYLQISLCKKSVQQLPCNVPASPFLLSSFVAMSTGISLCDLVFGC